MVVDQVYVTVENGKLNEVDIKYYIHRIQKHAKGKTLKTLELKIGSGFIDMRYSFHSFPFDRIRRINTTFVDVDKCVG